MACIQFNARSMLCLPTIPPYSLEDDKIKQQDEKNRTSTEVRNSGDDQAKTQESEVCKSLPEDIVEKIMSMVPFPQIFKLRTLSKSWLARLSAASAQNLEQRRLSTAFQKQVGEWSSRWKTFCPVVISREKFLAYDKVSHSWLGFPGFIPQVLLKGILMRSSIVEIDGALVLVSTRPETSRYVVNILTRSWTQLTPCLPLTSGTYLLGEKLVCQNQFNYKVVVFYGEFDHYLAAIYDSRFHSWSTRKFFNFEEPKAFLSPPAYLNGVLYMVVGNRPMDLLSFDVNEGRFGQLKLRPVGRITASGHVDLVVCNGSLVMIAKNWSTSADGLNVLRIDLASQKVLKVTRAPLGSLYQEMFNIPCVSDGDCIYFGKERLGGRVLTYRMKEDKWSCLPFLRTVHDDVYIRKGRINSSYRPGLNPFVAV